MEPEIYKSVLANSNMGASGMQYRYQAQLGYKDLFARFDYGQMQNQEKYNSPTPHLYGLNNILVKTAIFYSNSLFEEGEDKDT